MELYQSLFHGTINNKLYTKQELSKIKKQLSHPSIDNRFELLTLLKDVCILNSHHYLKENLYHYLYPLVKNINGNENKKELYILIIHMFLLCILYYDEIESNNMIENHQYMKLKKIINQYNYYYPFQDEYEDLLAIACKYMQKEDSIQVYKPFMDRLFDAKSEKQIKALLDKNYTQYDINNTTIKININSKQELFNKTRILKILKELYAYYQKQDVHTFHINYYLINDEEKHPKQVIERHFSIDLIHQKVKEEMIRQDQSIDTSYINLHIRK